MVRTGDLQIHNLTAVVFSSIIKPDFVRFNLALAQDQTYCVLRSAP